MSDKKEQQKSAPKPDTKADSNKTETVQLSAEELKKISGGAHTPAPPSPEAPGETPRGVAEPLR